MGDPADGRNTVGIDVTGDGRPEVSLTPEAFRAGNARIGDGIALGPAKPPVCRWALDVATYRGKQARFVATSDSRSSISIDDVRVEQRAPAWARLAAANVIGSKGTVTVALDSPLGVWGARLGPGQPAEIPTLLRPSLLPLHPSASVVHARYDQNRHQN